MAERESPPCSCTVQMLLAILGVLSGVALGAWIYASKRREDRPAPRLRPQYIPPVPALPPIDLAPQVAQIRALVRSANTNSDPAQVQQDTAQALSLLDSMEQSYGYEAVAAACNPDKLRALITKVRARFTQPEG